MINKKRLFVYIEEKQHIALGLQSVLNNKSKSDLIREAIDIYLEKVES